MNFYVSLINDTIDYIEENLSARMSLGDISRRFCISEFHFNRMFKTVVGQTLKQYIQGRKLTRALERLNLTDDSVIEIAMDFGFEYPEVFSRAFKKQFGFSPARARAAYRLEKIGVNPIAKAAVIERDLINYQGTMTLKGNCIYLEELNLKGISTEVNIDHEDFEPQLKSGGAGFLEASQKIPWFKQDRFYTVVNCHGLDNGEYTVFQGMETKTDHAWGTPASGFPASVLQASGLPASNFQNRQVPAGWYASFSYYGDMFTIRETFIDDLYRWVIVKEIELNANGVGMLNIFDQDYPRTQEVRILVPIRNPK